MMPSGWTHIGLLDIRSIHIHAGPGIAITINI